MLGNCFPHHHCAIHLLKAIVIQKTGYIITTTRLFYIDDSPTLLLLFPLLLLTWIPFLYCCSQLWEMQTLGAIIPIGNLKDTAQGG